MKKSYYYSILFAMFFVFANSATSQTATILDEPYDFVKTDEWRVSTNIYSSLTVNRGELPSVSSGYALINLDTYNQNDVNKFNVSLVETIRTFAAPNNAEINFSVWAKAPVSPSGVASLIILRDNASSLLAGFYLCSKQPGKVFIVTPSQSGGSITPVDISSFSIWSENLYSIKITYGRIIYSVNNLQVSTFGESSQFFETNLLRLQLGVFAPDASFPDAYDPALVPAVSASSNQTATLSVNRVLATIYYLATGIEETRMDLGFYLDKTNKVLYLREPGQKEIVIQDIYGRVVLKKLINNNISVEFLHSGIYFVSGNGLKTGKIVMP